MHHQSVFFRFSILRVFRLLRVFRPFRSNNTILLQVSHANCKIDYLTRPQDHRSHVPVSSSIATRSTRSQLFYRYGFDYFQYIIVR